MGKARTDKRRQTRIDRVYRTLGIESPEVRAYLVSLGSRSDQVEKEKPPVFIEAGTTSFSAMSPANAGLE